MDQLQIQLQRQRQLLANSLEYNLIIDFFENLINKLSDIREKLDDEVKDSFDMRFAMIKFFEQNIDEIKRLHNNRNKHSSSNVLGDE